MALIIFTPRDYPIHGHRGTTVLGRNFNGAFARSRKMPLYKNTPAQSKMRANFRNVLTNWRTLTPAEDFSWSSRTHLFFKTMASGKVINPKDIDLYSEQNIQTVVGSNSIITIGTDPVVFPAITIDYFSVSMDPFGLLARMSPNIMPAGFSYRFFASDLRPTRRSLFYPNDFRLIEEFTTNKPGGYNLSLSFPLAWPQTPQIFPPETRRLYSEICFVMRSIATGQAKLIQQDFASWSPL